MAECIKVSIEWSHYDYRNEVNIFDVIKHGTDEVLKSGDRMECFAFTMPDEYEIIDDD